MRRKELLKAALIAATLLLILTGVSGGTRVQAANANGCKVDYTPRSVWSNGFTTDVTITNTGSTAINGWTLTFAFPGDQHVTQGWNALWSQTGQNVTARNESYNPVIASNTSITIGFNGSYTSNNTLPTSFSINGLVCNVQPPAVALTSPGNNAQFEAPANIPLEASATAPTGESITRVEFYNGTTLIGSDSSAPYSLAWNSIPVGDYTLTAKAFASNNSDATSAAVKVSVIPLQTPRVVASTATLGVVQGKSATVEVSLSKQPSANVTVSVTRSSGSTGLSISSGATLTFTPTNWSTGQSVTIAAATGATIDDSAIFTASATGYDSTTIKATVRSSALPTPTERFLELYNDLKNPANGYFSVDGVPYHSIETLIVEAPDQGHETTSEAFSYWIWLEAVYGKTTGNWEPLNNSWAAMEKYIIPSHNDQPTNDAYNPNSPATYAGEWDDPNQYPSQLQTGVAVGKDPLASELKQTYGTSDVYGMHWLLDVDNWYGYGHCGDGTTKPAYINTFQRGPQESVWETVPHPSCETFTYGGKNGFLDLFTGDATYAKQWRYTDAPDADARAIQAVYWAQQWASAQGKASTISGVVSKAARMGDYLRYAFFDKYFKQPGCTSTNCPAGTGKDSAHYLLSWYYAWGGSLSTSGSWAWRIGSSYAHFGYQNPMAAYALSNVAGLKPQSPTAASDWSTSLKRQIEFYTWLQSAEGGIAGGSTNSWAGRYDQPPAGTSTFYGMAYDQQPVYHDPPSNQWFGFQAWSMERVAEYYYATGDSQAKGLLDKWVSWAMSKTTLNADGTYQIPSTLAWQGQPATWNASNPASNTNLHVSVVDYTNDVGVAAAYAKTLMYYASKANNSNAGTLAKALLDRMWTSYRDSKGISTSEVRSDYNRFDDGIYIPSGWSGKMANGDVIDSNSTFLSIRSKYKLDPDWGKVDSYLKGGGAPSFNYHRFWAQSDIAIAMATYDQLFT